MIEKETVPVESDYHLVYVRTAFVCFLHWVIVAGVVTLCVTGLYIGYPALMKGTGEAYASFVMAKTRLLHFVAAASLIVALMLRLYHSFSPSTRHDIHEILPTPGNIVAAMKLARYYITGGGEHYHYRYMNPIGGVSVFAMACFFAFEMATGFTLYSQQADVLTWGWLLWFPHMMESLFNGMNNIRLLHHLVMYVLIAQVIIHVYMAVYKDIYNKESDIASIVAGYKVFHKDDIARHKDRYAGRV